jgi:hypothetical protein
MEEKKAKNCPFNQVSCTSDCALFIDPADLNELMAGRLASLGVIDKERGVCSLKTLAMSSGRYIFENTSTKRF